MKKLMAVLLALVMVLSLAACGAEPEASIATAEKDAEAKPAEQAQELTKISVAYMPNWGALWAVATADAKGYFAEEGLDIDLVVFEDGPTEIAAMESGAIDISYIGPGAHKLCSTGNAQVFLLQHLDQGDFIIGLNGVKSLEDLKGKKVGYAAGTASETILINALDSVGLTMDDIEALSMDATALTTAALSGSVDAVSAWNPFAITILAEAAGAVQLANNVDFPSMVSPGSWVVNPKWAAENHDIMVRFTRAMYKGMDYAAPAATDDAIAEEVAGYVAAVIKGDPTVVLDQRYDGAWKTKQDIINYCESGEMLQLFADQQDTFIAGGAVDAATALDPSEFVLVDVMTEAAK